MKKLIVGCGYLGLRVAQKWIEEGSEVYALTRTKERAAQLESCGVKPIIGDVATLDVNFKLPDVEAVLYSLGYDRFSSYSRREIMNESLKNFLQHLPDTVERLIYTSSISVYGQSDGEWVDEKSITDPKKENGIVCLEAEEILRDFLLTEYEKERKIEWMVLRLAGLYGEGRVFRSVDQLKAGAPVGGEPEAWLNLIHVDDACEVILKAEWNLKKASVLVVADNTPVTRKEYYKELASIVDAPQPVFDPELADQQRGSGLNKRCSNQKMRQILDLKLKYPDFKTGLQSIYKQET